MKQSDDFRQNADNCAQLAERATDEPTHQRYKRMEAAWIALAQEQDWLDGPCGAYCGAGTARLGVWGGLQR
jgi:hypothetical protein